MTVLASPRDYLANLPGHETTGTISAPGLDRMEKLVDALGRPNERYPAVHITGTNGKGSVAALVTQLLGVHGLEVGTFTSPHLSCITERVRIDGAPVTNKVFDGALSRVAQAALRAGVVPTWFEAVTATGLLVFAQAKVDVAVIEVGMLGRWDATNVVRSEVAVVTNVELDHLDYAGPTRMHIAREKAGIVGPESTLVAGEMTDGLETVFADRGPKRMYRYGREFTMARARTAAGFSVRIVTPSCSYESLVVQLKGEHQCTNAALAVMATEAHLGRSLDIEMTRKALWSTVLAGRAEIIRESDPQVLLDGAHNPAAATALGRMVNEQFLHANPRILLCAMSGSRDPRSFLSNIDAPNFDLIVATQLRSRRAVEANAWTQPARDMNLQIVSIEDVHAATKYAMRAARHGLVVVTGSLHLLASVSETVLAGF
ncbi:hypothetical protein BTO20_00780 [Mycobacterium dioxanotrophicus]|uniref:tetrahydrofolate synthase n=1 Tax=Mycobacterium dioxanotrophicus TaxID=482462 RepID=A0A1Y0BWQ2_9MYCO|nr:Mur ligase family protein [Mycobacterium dioxanotrophicus]ART67326.1 hypothetical protein BTO20_00780 [Mycobacterium dioxanotrophicus]